MINIVDNRSNKIYAGIVLYNPDLQRLKMNIDALIMECAFQNIIIVDNGSSNVNEINRFLSDYDIVRYIRNQANKGIACALNQICMEVWLCGGEWCLTLDQDSVISSGLINEYMKYVSYENVGLISCRIEDRNFGRMYTKSDVGYEFIKSCITSSSFISMRIWEKVGGFNEDLFIDGVDFDYCIRLVKANYKILRTNNVALIHEVGHGRRVTLLGHTALVLNHVPWRYYYIARNYLFLGICHGQKLKWSIEVFKRILLVLIYERDKCSKLSYMIKGINHAIKGHLGILHEV